MSTQTAWPTGVIARYLTVGGATVDLTHRLTVHTPPKPFATLASCAGCPATEEVSHYRSNWGEEEHDPEAADADARIWAQSHAETCRAIPKPA
ncbi:hypothetical protein [Streptomyces sp. ME02-6979.5a]|uniref:hypothetical protein n=1 Tax=Streptomyces sp. ME02-6979.5a TaxID=462925 RepID=UPI0029AB96AE|nr:hypothetical protein [Streptomyces sp. ME02-6979.5a]MDX3336908.1 hypothetical protein [Streptomyces sp. ME02-6979.5a]